MRKNLDLRSELCRWFAQQKQFSTRKALAEGLGIPHETLRKYFQGRLPQAANLQRLSEVTGLDLAKVVQAGVSPRAPQPARKDKRIVFAARTLEHLQLELARSLAAILPARVALLGELEQRTSITTGPIAVQTLMDALQRALAPFLDNANALAKLRERISGSDAGYLSGLLGAIFDDQRLARWRQMTTYKYGTK